MRLFVICFCLRAIFTTKLVATFHLVQTHNFRGHSHTDYCSTQINEVKLQGEAKDEVMFSRLEKIQQIETVYLTNDGKKINVFGVYIRMHCMNA